MHDSSQGNAMTEIALALAMAFFSIMVLTMVSMGAGTGERISAVAALLAPAAGDGGRAGIIKPQTDDLIVVYHKGQFLNRDLKPVDPATITSGARVVLALDPALPMGEAMAARTRINVKNLIVSTLDDHWLETLERMNDEHE